MEHSLESERRPHLALLGPVSEDTNSPDPTLHFSNSNYKYDFYNARVPSFSYLDFAATWRPVRLLTLRAGINNFLDKDPPLINTTAVPPGQANTIDVYDQFGRQVFVAFSLQL